MLSYGRIAQCSDQQIQYRKAEKKFFASKDRSSELPIGFSRLIEGSSYSEGTLGGCNPPPIALEESQTESIKRASL